jgi:hypothetical protein
MDIVVLTGVVSDNKQLYRIFGPYQLAWYLRQHEYSVQVIDWVHELDSQTLFDLLDKFITQETKILAWGQMINYGTSGWWTVKFCEEILPKIKQKYPNLNVIMGGPSVHEFSHRYKNRTAFDYYFYGHAEDTILAYCNHIYRGGKMLPFEIFNGNRIVRETFADSILGDSGKFQISKCSFRWHKNDCIQTKESLPLEISRGCIFKCKFCRFPYIGKTKNDFSKDYDSIIDEIVYNYDMYGTTNYYMLEDTFNDNNEKINELHKRLTKLPFKINFGAYLRPDLLYTYDGQAEKLKEMGLIAGYLGIESFSEEGSKVISKGWSGKHGKTYLLRLRNEIWKDDVTFRSSMIIGLPPETKQDVIGSNRWFIDNQMHNWKWHALSLQRDIKGPWVSEFDREHEKYGFTWILKYGKSIWKTEYMDEHIAEDLGKYLTSSASKYQKPSCWELIEKGNYGFDLHEEKNKFLVVSAAVDNLTSKRKQFIEKYVSDLKGL